MFQPKPRMISAWTRCQRSTSVLLYCTPLVFAPLSAQAEQAENETEEETFRLAPIIVNAQVQADDDAESTVAQELWIGGKVATSILDTPASVSVITQKEIEQRDANTTEEVLQYTAGAISDYWGTDDRNDYFQIRGYKATTYRDGLTLGSMRGVREEPYAFERVEVLRGANSTLFGPADPGGSINFVSKQPRFERFSDTYLTLGSFSHVEAGVDVGNVLNEDETLAYRLTGKVKDSEREYDHSRDNTGFVMGGLTWDATDNTSATVIVDYLNTDSTPNSGGYGFDKEYDRSDFYGEPDYNFHDVERITVSGQVSHDFENGFTLRSNIRYSDLTDDFGYVYITDSDSRVGSVVDRDYFGSDTEAQELIGNIITQYSAQFNRFDSNTTAGIEYRNASSSSTSVYGDTTSIDLNNPSYSGAPSSLSVYQEQSLDYSSLAVFVQQDIAINDQYIVTAGLRNDLLDISREGESAYTGSLDAEDNFSEFSFRGALTYIVNDSVSTYVSMVESVEPPEVGSEPERGEQYELGAKYSPADINAVFSAAVYQLTIGNDSIAIVGGDGSITRESIDESQVHGLDLEARAEVTANLSITAAYSYMMSEIERREGSEEKEGNELPTAPNHTASVWGFYEMPELDLGVGLGARYVGAYYFSEDNDVKSDEAVIFDTSLSYRPIENTDFSVHVSNLLDEQHVANKGSAIYYNPGREITATVSYNW
ncbi:ligand-gated channel [Saccharospirillum sp. MSK14-1]|uniref:TonB-dependent siderophore receptor n=1 Tax=Saccharospirillum sp. MSK14-1 TaxID=1897632 RepID=UPI000D35FC91|nr:TonB-dependent siderophore receptor [Saccharospirillum sp. MSK14-1]PTY37888.1 ligand-gated channel [Saccharospirillum sp. MSK14-1]